MLVPATTRVDNLGQVASASYGLAQTVPGGYILRLLATLLLLSSFSSAQESNSAAAAAKSQPVSDLPVWSTTLTQPNRYISAHGIRGFAGGYSEDGLEFWSFPLQLVSGYHLSFVLPKASLCFCDQYPHVNRGRSPRRDPHLHCTGLSRAGTYYDACGGPRCSRPFYRGRSQ